MSLCPNQKITRTFEMENTPFGVQLEIYEFEKLTDDTSKLNMHVIYESGCTKRPGAEVTLCPGHKHGT